MLTLYLRACPLTAEAGASLDRRSCDPQQPVQSLIRSKLSLRLELFALPALVGRKLCLEDIMNGLIYLVGLVVVILAVLSFFGLR